MGLENFSQTVCAAALKRYFLQTENVGHNFQMANRFSDFVLWGIADNQPTGNFKNEFESTWPGLEWPEDKSDLSRLIVGMLQIKGTEPFQRLSTRLFLISAILQKCIDQKVEIRNNLALARLVSTLPQSLGNALESIRSEITISYNNELKNLTRSPIFALADTLRIINILKIQNLIGEDELGSLIQKIPEISRTQDGDNHYLNIDLPTETRQVQYIPDMPNDFDLACQECAALFESINRKPTRKEKEPERSELDPVAIVLKKFPTLKEADAKDAKIRPMGAKHFDVGPKKLVEGWQNKRLRRVEVDAEKALLVPAVFGICFTKAVFFVDEKGNIVRISIKTVVNDNQNVRSTLSNEIMDDLYGHKEIHFNGETIISLDGENISEIYTKGKYSKISIWSGVEHSEEWEEYEKMVNINIKDKTFVAIDKKGKRQRYEKGIPVDEPLSAQPSPIEAAAQQLAQPAAEPSSELIEQYQSQIEAIVNPNDEGYKYGGIIDVPENQQLDLLKSLENDERKTQWSNLADDDPSCILKFGASHVYLVRHPVFPGKLVVLKVKEVEDNGQENALSVNEMAPQFYLTTSRGTLLPSFDLKKRFDSESTLNPDDIEYFRKQIIMIERRLEPTEISPTAIELMKEEFELGGSTDLEGKATIKIATEDNIKGNESSNIRTVNWYGYDFLYSFDYMHDVYSLKYDETAQTWGYKASDSNEFFPLRVPTTPPLLSDLENKKYELKLAAGKKGSPGEEIKTIDLVEVGQEQETLDQLANQIQEIINDNANEYGGVIQKPEGAQDLYLNLIAKLRDRFDENKIFFESDPKMFFIKTDNEHGVWVGPNPYDPKEVVIVKCFLKEGPAGAFFYPIVDRQCSGVTAPLFNPGDEQVYQRRALIGLPSELHTRSLLDVLKNPSDQTLAAHRFNSFKEWVYHVRDDGVLMEPTKIGSVEGPNDIRTARLADGPDYIINFILDGTAYEIAIDIPSSKPLMETTKFTYRPIKGIGTVIEVDIPLQVPANAFSADAKVNIALENDQLSLNVESEEVNFQGLLHYFSQMQFESQERFDDYRRMLDFQKKPGEGIGGSGAMGSENIFTKSAEGEKDNLRKVLDSVEIPIEWRSAEITIEKALTIEENELQIYLTLLAQELHNKLIWVGGDVPRTQLLIVYLLDRFARAARKQDEVEQPVNGSEGNGVKVLRKFLEKLNNLTPTLPSHGEGEETLSLIAGVNFLSILEPLPKLGSEKNEGWEILPKEVRTKLQDWGVKEDDVTVISVGSGESWEIKPRKFNDQLWLDIDEVKLVFVVSITITPKDFGRGDLEGHYKYVISNMPDDNWFVSVSGGLSLRGKPSTGSIQMSRPSFIYDCDADYGIRRVDILDGGEEEFSLVDGDNDVVCTINKNFSLYPTNEGVVIFDKNFNLVYFYNKTTKEISMPKVLSRDQSPLDMVGIDLNRNAQEISDPNLISLLGAVREGLVSAGMLKEVAEALKNQEWLSVPVTPPPTPLQGGELTPTVTSGEEEQTATTASHLFTQLEAQPEFTPASEALRNNLLVEGLPALTDLLRNPETFNIDLEKYQGAIKDRARYLAGIALRSAGEPGWQNGNLENTLALDQQFDNYLNSDDKFKSINGATDDQRRVLAILFGDLEALIISLRLWINKDYQLSQYLIDKLSLIATNSLPGLEKLAQTFVYSFGAAVEIHQKLSAELSIDLTQTHIFGQQYTDVLTNSPIPQMDGSGSFTEQVFGFEQIALPKKLEKVGETELLLAKRKLAQQIRSLKEKLPNLEKEHTNWASDASVLNEAISSVLGETLTIDALLKKLEEGNFVDKIVITLTTHYGWTNIDGAKLLVGTYLIKLLDSIESGLTITEDAEVETAYKLHPLELSNDSQAFSLVASVPGFNGYENNVATQAGRVTKKLLQIAKPESMEFTEDFVKSEDKKLFNSAISSFIRSAKAGGTSEFDPVKAEYAMWKELSLDAAWDSLPLDWLLNNAVEFYAQLRSYLQDNGWTFTEETEKYLVCCVLFLIKQKFGEYPPNFRDACWDQCARIYAEFVPYNQNSLTDSLPTLSENFLEDVDRWLEGPHLTRICEEIMLKGNFASFFVVESGDLAAGSNFEIDYLSELPNNAFQQDNLRNYAEQRSKELLKNRLNNAIEAIDITDKDDNIYGDDNKNEEQLYKAVSSYFSSIEQPYNLQSLLEKTTDDAVLNAFSNEVAEIEPLKGWQDGESAKNYVLQYVVDVLSAVRKTIDDTLPSPPSSLPARQTGAGEDTSPGPSLIGGGEPPSGLEGIGGNAVDIPTTVGQVLDDTLGDTAVSFGDFSKTVWKLKGESEVSALLESNTITGAQLRAYVLMKIAESYQKGSPENEVFDNFFSLKNASNQLKILEKVEETEESAEMPKSVLERIVRAKLIEERFATDRAQEFNELIEHLEIKLGDENDKLKNAEVIIEGRYPIKKIIVKLESPTKMAYPGPGVDGDLISEIEFIPARQMGPSPRPSQIGLKRVPEAPVRIDGSLLTGVEVTSLYFVDDKIRFAFQSQLGVPISLSIKEKAISGIKAVTWSEDNPLLTLTFYDPIEIEVKGSQEHYLSVAVNPEGEIAAVLNAADRTWRQDFVPIEISGSPFEKNKKLEEKIIASLSGVEDPEDLAAKIIRRFNELGITYDDISLDNIEFDYYAGTLILKHIDNWKISKQIANETNLEANIKLIKVILSTGSLGAYFDLENDTVKVGTIIFTNVQDFTFFPSGKQVFRFSNFSADNVGLPYGILNVGPSEIEIDSHEMTLTFNNDFLFEYNGQKFQYAKMGFDGKITHVRMNSYDEWIPINEIHEDINPQYKQKVESILELVRGQGVGERIEFKPNAGSREYSESVPANDLSDSLKSILGTEGSVTLDFIVGEDLNHEEVVSDEFNQLAAWIYFRSNKFIFGVFEFTDTNNFGLRFQEVDGKTYLVSNNIQTYFLIGGEAQKELYPYQLMIAIDDPEHVIIVSKGNRYNYRKDGEKVLSMIEDEVEQQPPGIAGLGSVDFSTDENDFETKKMIERLGFYSVKLFGVPLWGEFLENEGGGYTLKNITLFVPTVNGFVESISFNSNGIPYGYKLKGKWNTIPISEEEGPKFREEIEAIMSKMGEVYKDFYKLNYPDGMPSSSESKERDILEDDYGVGTVLVNEKTGSQYIISDIDQEMGHEPSSGKYNAAYTRYELMYGDGESKKTLRITSAELLTYISLGYLKKINDVTTTSNENAPAVKEVKTSTDDADTQLGIDIKPFSGNIVKAIESSGMATVDVQSIMLGFNYDALLSQPEDVVIERDIGELKISGNIVNFRKIKLSKEGNAVNISAVNSDTGQNTGESVFVRGKDIDGLWTARMQVGNTDYKFRWYSDGHIMVAYS